MCGRYTLKAEEATLEKHFGIRFPAEARYNVAPSQSVPVIREGLSMMKWGLVPAWSKEPKVSFSNINARRETVETSAAFRSAFKHRRCLMPADGFFEWFPGPPKVPHYFRLAKGEPFAFAGIWEAWGKGEEAMETCALITTEANAVVAPVHGRMPVILHPSDYAIWLDPKAEIEDLRAMLEPYDGPMTDTAVSPFVNIPKNQGPKCVEPLK